jgi:hypothetical protein
MNLYIVNKNSYCLVVLRNESLFDRIVLRRKGKEVHKNFLNP